MLKRRGKKKTVEPAGRDERTTAALLLKQQSALKMRFEKEPKMSRAVGPFGASIPLGEYSCLHADVSKDGVEFYASRHFHTLTDNEALELARWLIRMLTPPNEF